ncbi:hypothetical protein [Brevibacillus laterosporus]|uniref:Uncharacterized protein n=1 Tax=Brevibacillus laterosporus TaxID=1465 RepID=A0AAP3DL44_BRELA|nr:hypothetical protein [Brevibacillus laterosporus]MCR8982866.1 hypothetical protein [Brevibacillus laterosporus]MCZ0810022.1 hypothetical protein [Brevibacillus laterosporus]MCZ0828666.1 hypothetical protein [Brevibacillus laterosporus]MCZ0852709.1 hypothetical protein [Brevibacillus laterosporus]
MSFRINDLMITVLPKKGQISECRPGFTSCDGGCSNPNTRFPAEKVDSNELTEIKEILRHAISRVEAPDLEHKILPGTCEGIEALEEKLQGALNELRSYMATKENSKDI